MGKFERKFGKYAIHNLMIYLIAGYAIGYLLFFTNKTLYSLLTFNPYYIFRGQIWRLVTWVVTMPEALGIFTIIMLFLYYSLGKSLERTWGAYRFNVYIFSGILFTIVGGLILYVAMCLATGISIFDSHYALGLGNQIGGVISTYYINMSIFLAFAATYPDMQLLLYFIIPVKVKWFGYIYGAFIVFDIFRSYRYGGWKYGLFITVLIVCSLLNFLIYFLTSRKKLKGRGPFASVKQKAKKTTYKQSVAEGQKANARAGGAIHKCYICGRTELDNPNLTFRFCSKCSGSKEYCEDHLFTHQHS